MRAMMITGSLLVALPFLMPAPAAAIEYPWCAIYTGRDGYNATNCGFSTLAQCRATISGIGGICQENPRYPEPVRKGKRTYRN